MRLNILGNATLYNLPFIDPGGNFTEVHTHFPAYMLFVMTVIGEVTFIIQ